MSAEMQLPAQIADWSFDHLVPGGHFIVGNFNLDSECIAATGESF